MPDEKHWRSILDSTVGQQILRTISDIGPIGITISMPNQPMPRYANQRLLDMLGYTIEEFETMSINDLTHPDDQAQSRENAGLLNRGEIDYFQMEKRYIRKDGSSLWASVTGIGVKNDSDGSIYTIILIEDISKRRLAQEALQTSEERYRQLFNSNPQPVFVYDLEEFKLLAFNSAALRYYKYDTKEMKNLTFRDLFAEPHSKGIDAWFDEPVPNRTTLPQTFDHQRKDGVRFPVQVTRRFLAFGDQPACLSVVHDMTMQRAAERERDLAYQNLENRVIERTQQIDKRREVAESLRHLMSFLNQNCTVDEILDLILAQACDLFGGCAGVICSLSIQRICTLHSTQNIEASTHVQLVDFPGWQQLAQMTETGQPITVMRAAGSDWDYSQALVKMPVFESLLALPLRVDDRVEYGLIIYYSQRQDFAHDDVQVALSFATQSALAIESAHLRQRVSQIAIAEERSRLARDLHDSVTQQLYSLSLLVEGWRRLHEADKLELSPDHLIEVGNIAQQSLKEMRLLIYELRPDTLDSEGLLGALHRRLNTVEERTGIQTRIIADTLTNLPAPIETGLYRIAQEALNNVLKHAHAEHVVVHLHEAHGKISLEIRDDGRGFDLATAHDTGGIGLSSMQERALQIGATLDVKSTPRVGTRIEVILPKA